jgi:hypothetical protein
MSPREVIENREKSLSKWKDIFDIAHSIFVILALLCAGYWFFVRSEIKPRADVSHEITHRTIHGEHNWVHVLVNIKNIGYTPVVIEKGKVYIQQIKPLSDDLKKAIESGDEIIDKQNCMVIWPNACKQQYERNQPKKLLPGETERKSYEFIVSLDVKTIKAYSYFESDTQEIGTRTVTIYDLKDVK